ncbi:MAG: imidazolonepropionase [Acidimicrobiia bacterium]|nr:imidazolonepropionase [Acidimicrobiia bacterium]
MAQLVLTGVGQLVTNQPGDGDLLGLLPHAAVAISDGVVSWVGPAASLPDSFGDAAVFHCEGRAVIPGFIDAHTHLVFGGSRADEFARRLRGESYRDILAAGGGIHSTVAATRDATFDELVESSTARVQRMLRGGTTTVEAKSGYGLNTADEVRILEVIAAVAEANPMDVVPTFLGAHVPDEGVDSGDYTELVITEMLPAVASLAAYCDVFVDEGAFSVSEARRILRAGDEHGLKPRVHAEQLTHTGAARLAAELGAASADHLDNATPDDAQALAAAETVAVLLPAVSFSMRSPQPPARMLWDAGVTVALATDLNPGTSNVESMPLVIALACLEMGLTPEEALWAATRGGALALEADDKGRLVGGAIADLVVLDADTYLDIPYRPGSDLVWAVVKDGELVHQ